MRTFSSFFSVWYKNSTGIHVLNFRALVYAQTSRNYSIYLLVSNQILAVGEVELSWFRFQVIWEDPNARVYYIGQEIMPNFTV